MSQELRQLHEALLDLTGIFNSPQPDAILINTASVDLERALFPLLSRIERRGPLGIGELAELSGRDYTTVSRQVTKLEQMGLVNRRVSSIDKYLAEKNWQTFMDNTWDGKPLCVGAQRLKAPSLWFANFLCLPT